MRGYSLKVRSLLFSTAAAALSFAPLAQADTWSEADEFFAQREGNREAIAQARARYQQLLSQATNKADKIRAVSQLGRLAVYEGEMILSKDDVAGRKAIFSSCFCASPKVVMNPLPRPSCEQPGFVEAISPANLGEEHPAYYYFRGICTAYFGEVAGPFEKLAYVQWLKADLAKGQTLDTRFEGGGIQRVASGVYVNPKAAAVQLYNPDLALEYAGKALATQAYPGDANSGTLYYENWQAQLFALVQLASDRPNEDFKQRAIELATKILSEMDEKMELDDLPAGRVPEFKYAYRRISTTYQTLTGNAWQTN